MSNCIHSPLALPNNDHWSNWICSHSFGLFIWLYGPSLNLIPLASTSWVGWAISPRTHLCWLKLLIPLIHMSCESIVGPTEFQPTWTAVREQSTSTSLHCVHCSFPFLNYRQQFHDFWIRSTSSLSFALSLVIRTCCSMRENASDHILSDEWLTLRTCIKPSIEYWAYTCHLKILLDWKL